MSAYDRSVFEKVVREKALEKINPEIRKTPNTTVDPFLLTGTESWDSFVKELQLLIEIARGNQIAIYQELAAKPDFSYEFLIRNKLQAMLLDERIKTLEEVIKLPKSMFSV